MSLNMWFYLRYLYVPAIVLLFILWRRCQLTEQEKLCMILTGIVLTLLAILLFLKSK